MWGCRRTLAATLGAAVFESARSALDGVRRTVKGAGVCVRGCNHHAHTPA